ncbi:MAG: hypothetical protein PHR64_02105 [Candidatus Shapirobacteria bacterium]|nr:hypothetical protein [Candidatus Shapirobacteria bacterium]MDD5073729.1 hypothetical protein [Candidatus Shapirobacteria bacterium]MDD5481718.1 hypothetical protein [Candidatus Shapirobacteria bacterium]
MSLDKKNQISTILISKNKTPRKDLAWCDQVIILDAIKDCAENRNQALKQAKNRWVLFLKENEFVSRELAKEVTNFINLADQKGYTGAQIISKRVFLEQAFNYGAWFAKKEIRLGRRVGEWSKKNGSLVWNFPGQKTILANFLIHRPYQNLAQLLTTTNQQTTIKAQRAHQHQKKCPIFWVVFSPWTTFKKSFFLKLGFLDGSAGFILATLEAFKTFLVNSKLWLLGQQKKTIRADN